MEETILADLRTGGWNFGQPTAEGYYLLSWPNPVGALNIYFMPHFISRSIIRVFVYYPGNAPSEKRDEIIKLCALVNRTLLLGNLEINPLDHSICTRAGVHFLNTSYQSGMAEGAIVAAIKAMEKWAPAIAAVVEENMEAQKAFKKYSSQ
jgi:hypothetical protein